MFDKVKNAASNLGDLGEMGDLREYVDEISFPASKDEVIAQLERSGAQEDIIAKVRDVAQNHFKGEGDLISSFMSKR
jgi:hypothetical protein